MAGAAGDFVTRSFEAMLKECSGKKYTSLQKAIQKYQENMKGMSQESSSGEKNDPANLSAEERADGDEAAKEGTTSESLQSVSAPGEKADTVIETVKKSEPITTALASADCTLDRTQVELVLLPLRLAFESKNVKLVEPALNCLHKLIAYDHLEGDPGLEGGKNAPLFTDILNMICDCVDSSSDSTILQVLKVLFTAVASTKFKVHGDPLLGVIRVCYNISLNCKSPINQATSEAMLIEIISIVSRRMESDKELEAFHNKVVQLDDGKKISRLVSLGFSKMTDAHETDKNIEIWKIKKLIKQLESVRGNSTSVISLIVPPQHQISSVAKMLGDEIKNTVNKKSVLSAITSAQQRLKLYNEVPPNGLVLYTGTIATKDGKENEFTVVFEPFNPISASLYFCNSKFHTEALNELLESDGKFGFMVTDERGTLFGTVSGNSWEVLHKLTFHFLKKDRILLQQGSRKFLRFPSLIVRSESKSKLHYLSEIYDLAARFFINPATSQPNIEGLILAFSFGSKAKLSRLVLSGLDEPLRAKILNVVEVYYGGENGFNQAIELSSEYLSNLKFIQVKRLIRKYFEEISQDTGRSVYGVDDTVKALILRAVETLIVWENLDINRYVLKNCVTGKSFIKYLNKEQEADQTNFHDQTVNTELEVQEKISLLEWLAKVHKHFCCTIEFVTNKSPEGSQFCRGFGGIGAILRYPIGSFDEVSDDGESNENSD